MSLKKPELPYGWVVKHSKSYPDRVYYFNVNTGASTWEFPDLLKPLLAGASKSPTSPSVVTPTSVPNVKPSNRESKQPFSSRLKESSKQNLLGHKPSPVPHRSSQFSAPKLSEKVLSLSDNVSKKAGEPVKSISKIAGKPVQSLSEIAVEPVKGLSEINGEPVKSHSTNKGQKSDLNNQGGGKIVSGAKNKVDKWSPYKGKRKTGKDVTKADKIKNTSVNNRPLNTNRYTVEGSYNPTNFQDFSYNRNSATSALLESLISPSIHQRVVTATACETESAPRFAKRSADSVSRTLEASPNAKRKRCSSLPMNDLRDKLLHKQETGPSNGQKQTGKVDKKKNNSNKKFVFKDGRICRQETSVYRQVVCRKTEQDLPPEDLVVCKEIDTVPQDKFTSDFDSDTDRRKVVNTLQQELHGKRSIRVKGSSPPSVRNGASGPKSGAMTTGLKASQSPSLNKNQDKEDSNNNKKTEMFIGSKDKLLSIQSWIENLQEGSDSPEAYTQTTKFEGDMTSFDKSTDSGYSSIVSPVIKTETKRVERGWPGELRMPQREERELVEMEVDTWEVNEPVDPQLLEAMEMDPVLIEVREEVRSNRKATIDFALPQQSEIRKGLLIVVDTNVLISKLNFLEDLRDNNIKVHGKPVLYIPWIVLQELDYLKVKLSTKRANPATQARACKAVSFLQDQFSNNHPRVMGQSPKQAEEAAMEFSACCNDDVILQASLHCQKKYPTTHVVLLTNDINLINKAIVSNVKAFTSAKLLEGVKKLQVKNLKPAPTSSTLNSSPLVSLETSIPLASTSTQCSAQNLASPVPNSSSGQASMCSTPNLALSGPQPLSAVNGPQTPSTSITSPTHIDSSSMNKENKPQQNSSALSVTDQSAQDVNPYTEETLVDDVMCKLKKVLKEAMGRVLEVEMKAAYNDIWLDIVLRKPPWSFRDILDCWKKHWRAVFGFLFNRRLEDNISDIRDNIFKIKGPNLQDMCTVCDKCLPILHECVLQKKYGDTMSDITSCVVTVQDLCEDVKSGKVSPQSISSLDAYLKTKLYSSKSKSKAHTPNPSPAKSISYTTTVLSGADKPHVTTNQSHTNSTSHQSVPTDSDISHDSVSYCVKSPDHIPSIIQSHDQISPNLIPSSPVSMETKSCDFQTTPVVSQDHLSDSFGHCDQLLNNSINQHSVLNDSTNQHSVLNDSTNQHSVFNDSTNKHSVLSEGTNQQWPGAEESSSCIEAPAGELLQDIWQLIFKCCDHINTELSGSISGDVKQQVEEQLQRLVPAAKQLRVIYTGLLQTDISQLPNCEDQFTELCALCNNFFSMLQIQENIPEVPVTTLQFLVLFSSPQHRSTLNEFQQQLDTMLRHLYGCLNILYPDQ